MPSEKKPMNEDDSTKEEDDKMMIDEVAYEPSHVSGLN